MISPTTRQKKNYMLLRRSRSIKTILGLVAIYLFTGALQQSVASSSLAVAPTRVVFEGRTRTASVGLINRGNETAVFRVSFEQKRMSPDGKIASVDTPQPGELFADKMVRFSPRQVTLPPGKAQVVRLMLRKPPGLADGEYRSHMLFREVPQQSAKSITGETSKKNNLSIQIIPVVGISIPVIVRHGRLNSTTNLEKLEFQRSPKEPNSGFLSLEITRSGNKSVFGDFTAYLHQGKEKLIVGKANGVALYTPNTRRKFVLNIQAPKGISLDQGRLEVEYTIPPADGDELLGKASLALNTGS
jgi:P pilus assembly chaperone PapD